MAHSPDHVFMYVMAVSMLNGRTESLQSRLWSPQARMIYCSVLFFSFYPSPPPLFAAISLFSVAIGLLLFCLFTFFFFFFQDSTISVRSYSICISLSDLLRLAQYPLGPFRLLQMGGFHSFLWLSTFHCINAPPPLHPSSLDGHPGCLHVWATGNSAAMNMGEHVSLQISVLVFFR